MTSIKKGMGKFLSLGPVPVFFLSALLITGAVSAATTIGLNVTTDGTITAVSESLTNGTTTLFAAGRASTTNSFTTNASTTKLSADGFFATNAFISGYTGTNATITNATTTLFAASRSTTTNAFVSNASTTKLSADNASLGTTFTSTASTTKLSADEFFATNGFINGLTWTTANLTVTNATSTALFAAGRASTTNSFSTNASTTNLSADGFFATNAFLNGYEGTNATVTNSTTTLAAFTHSTSTSAFISNASTTQLSATDASLGTTFTSTASTTKLSADNASFGSTLTTNASTTNLTVSGRQWNDAGSMVVFDKGTATVVEGVGATLNKQSGIVTTESTSTAAGSTYNLLLIDSLISSGSNIMAQATLGTATAGTPLITKITPGAGSAVIIVSNVATSSAAGAPAFNGTLLVNFFVIN